MEMGEFCQKLISKYYFTAPWYSDTFTVIVHCYRRRYRPPKWQENGGEAVEAANPLQRRQLETQ